MRSASTTRPMARKRKARAPRRRCCAWHRSSCSSHSSCISRAAARPRHGAVADIPRSRMGETRTRRRLRRGDRTRAGRAARLAGGRGHGGDSGGPCRRGRNHRPLGPPGAGRFRRAHLSQAAARGGGLALRDLLHERSGGAPSRRSGGADPHPSWRAGSSFGVIDPACGTGTLLAPPAPRSAMRTRGRGAWLGRARLCGAARRASRWRCRAAPPTSG